MIKFLYKKIDHNDLDKKGFLKGKKNYEAQFLENNAEWQTHEPDYEIETAPSKKNKKKLMPDSNNPNVKGQNKKNQLTKRSKKNTKQIRVSLANLAS